MKRRAPMVLLALVSLAAAYAAWDNVLTDNAAVRADAEAAACGERARCAQPHGLTKADRTPFGQTFEYTFKDGVTAVTCRREQWLVGDRRCVVTGRKP